MPLANYDLLASDKGNFVTLPTLILSNFSYYRGKKMLAQVVHHSWQEQKNSPVMNKINTEHPQLHNGVHAKCGDRYRCWKSTICSYGGPYQMLTLYTPKFQYVNYS